MRVEELNYRPGGFHPVHLNDKFKKSRYIVIHKLGHGGFATVWLGRDTVRERYVALKILAARLSSDSPEVQILRHLRNWDGSKSADAELEDVKGKGPEEEMAKEGDTKKKAIWGKQYVMSMLDHFFIHGPNGRHLCVVSEVAGPSIKQFNECPGLRLGTRRLRGEVSRRVSLQATQGLAFIHSTGTVHGDFTAANILIQLANIDEWTVDEIYERLGAPQTQDFRSSGSTEGGSAPKYTVDAIDMKLVDPKWLSDQIMIIDFGIAFLVDESSDDIGTPKNYCAPEFMFEDPRSVHSDIWALGCTIFEIRTGHRLFQYGRAPTRDRMLIEMVKTLGPLPALWWDSWEKGNHWYEFESMPGGKLASLPDGGLHDMIREIGTHDGDDRPRRTTFQDMGFEDVNLSSDGPKSSPSVTDKRSTTTRLIELVEQLTTSEAIEVISILNNKHKSGLSWSGERSLDLGARPGTSDSKSGDKTSSSGTKSEDKSIASEGISTGFATLFRVETNEKTLSSDEQPKHNVVALLEPYGTVVTIEETDCLENLLRSALTYAPEKRVTATKLSEHHWFTETYPTVIQPRRGDRPRTIGTSEQG